MSPFLLSLYLCLCMVLFYHLNHSLSPILSLSLSLSLSPFSDISIHLLRLIQGHDAVQNKMRQEALVVHLQEELSLLAKQHAENDARICSCLDAMQSATAGLTTSDSSTANELVSERATGSFLAFVRLRYFCAML